MIKQYRKTNNRFYKEKLKDNKKDVLKRKLIYNDILYISLYFYIFFCVIT